MNNIFIKNLTTLKLKNPILASKLQTYIPTEIPQLVQENGAFNLLYKNILIHHSQNPLAEAHTVFNISENSPIAIHVVYGLGLGYLFQVASLNSKGTVILYEPDLNILWTVFSLVDFSTDIMKNNVIITSELNELERALYEKSGMKNSPQLVSLPSQRELNKENFNNFVKHLQDKIGSYAMDLKYTKEKFYPSLKMLLQNIPHLLKENPLAKFKDCYKGKTAVVISAGPTLDRNIETLKKYRDKYILFTVGTAVKTLYKNNIKPDFLCIIETYNSSKQVEGLDLSDVYFITEPYSNPALRNFQYKKTFSHISANTPINHFWGEICEENIDEYWSKGTVSYTALNCARLLGCSKIILVGQDLAYIEGQCYSKDSAYKDLKCQFNKELNKWEITAEDFESFANAISPSSDENERRNTANRRLHNLNESLYYVKGIQGIDIPTESVYAAFIPPLSEYTEHFNDREYINTSMVGAQIDGFKNIPLEEALKDSEIINNIELNENSPINAEVIFSNLKQKLEELKTADSILNEGKKYIKNINNDLKRYKNVDVNILKTLKKLSLNYLELSSDFANKSKLFDYITTADKIDLDYEMKMTQEFTVDSVTNICNKLEIFYNNALARIIEIEGLINENLNTKS